MLVTVFPVRASQSLDSAYRTTGTAVVEAFEAQRKVLQLSSAVVLNGRREIAYGVVVSPEGYILTKASELSEAEDLGVRVDLETYKDIKVLATSEEWDVAIVKVPASGLVPVSYAPTGAIPQGSWVIANGVTSLRVRRALAGIVSAKIRPIPEGGGNLGIALKEEDSLEIEEVGEDGGAKAAGLKKGDVIAAVDGKKVSNFEEIAEILKHKRPGTVVKLTFFRKEEELSADVRLDPGPLTRNDMMSGMFSQRRSGFPRVMQHDIAGDKTVVGGPLLDLDGRCVGMNIARANRAESFAIPMEDLKELAGRLIKQARAAEPPK